MATEEEPITTDEPNNTNTKYENKDNGEEAETTTSTKLPIKSSNFHIPIHNLITKSQNSHGLLSHQHDDYSQYRSYCTRRLSRLRHAPSVRRNLTHGSKSAGAAAPHNSTTNHHPNGGGGGGKTSKAKHAFHSRCKVTPTDANSHINYVLVGLYETERAWAQAMELRGRYEGLVSSNEPNNGGNLSEALAGGTKKVASPGEVRRHYLRRLKKATGLVEELEGIVNEVCDDVTGVETKAYGSWIRGNWFCEMRDWKNACKEYAVALHLCQVLSKTTTTTTNTTTSTSNNDDASPSSIDLIPSSTITKNQEAAEALQRSDLFTARCHDVLQPLLRYCQYELQQKDGTTSSTIITEEELLQQGDNDDDDNDPTNMNAFLRTKLESIRHSKLVEEEASSTKALIITFREHDIPVENPSTRVALLRVRELEQDFHGASSTTNNNTDHKKKKKSKAKRESQFLELLDRYDDVLSTITHDLSTLTGITEAGPAVNKKRFECRSLLGYCRNEKLKLSMGRNERTVEGLRAVDCERTTISNKKGVASQDGDDNEARYKRVEEIAHVYDALLQDARAITNLPGGRTAPTSDHTEEDEFLLEANANVLRLRALRSYYLGRMYASSLISRYPEAIALYDQTSILASEAAEEMLACEGLDDEGVRSMAELEEEVVGARVRAEVSLFLGGSGSGGGGRGLLERLDDFDAGGGGSVDGFGVGGGVGERGLEAVVCKPMFFDVGGSYVGEFPVQELEMYVGEYSGVAGRRGLVGGLLDRWFRSG